MLKRTMSNFFGPCLLLAHALLALPGNAPAANETLLRTRRGGRRISGCDIPMVVNNLEARLDHAGGNRSGQSSDPQAPLLVLA